jgi:hypothetical protein
MEKTTKLLAIVLLALFLFTTVFTFILFEETHRLTDEIQILKTTARTPNGYDYVIFQDGADVKAKNAQNQIEFTSTDISEVLNEVAKHGSRIEIQSGYYALSGNVEILNRKDVTILADGVALQCNGHKIGIYGDNYELSQSNTLEGLMIINGSIRIENSYRTKISSVTFENCTIAALELANSNTWTEATQIEDSHFEHCKRGIVFETPTFQGTDSYSKTEIIDCNFNVYDGATGIVVESEASFVDGSVRDIRIWLKNSSQSESQTGIYLAGSMMNTYLSSVVFESFTNQTTVPDAVRCGILYSNSVSETPIIGSGVQFLGDFTNFIYNSGGAHVYGVGGLFKGERLLNFSKTEIVHAYPLRIADFDLELTVSNISPKEAITVTIGTNFIDQTQLTYKIEFKEDGSRWLTNNEKYEIYPSRNLLNSFSLNTDSSISDSNAEIYIRWIADTA